MTLSDTKTIPPETTATRQPKRGSMLNFILLLVLLALLAWTVFALVNQSRSHAPQPHETEAKLALMQDRITALQDAVTPLQERLRLAEAQLAELQAKPLRKPSAAGEALSSGMLSALEARTQELEKRISALAPAAPGAPLESLKSVEARLAQLEAKTMQSESVESRRLAKLRAFYLMQSAIFSGRPYSAEYIGFSDLVGEPQDIADAMDLLNSYAEEGIPSQQALVKQFMDAQRQSLNLPLPENAPFFERLGHNITSLVTIRKVGEQQKGLEKQAILARAEAHLKKGELEAAVAEIQSMSVSEQAYFSDWLEDAKVRLDIPATLSQIQESLLKPADTSSGADE